MGQATASHRGIRRDRRTFALACRARVHRPGAGFPARLRTARPIRRHDLRHRNLDHTTVDYATEHAGSHGRGHPVAGLGSCAGRRRAGRVVLFAHRCARRHHHRRRRGVDDAGLVPRWCLPRRRCPPRRRRYRRCVRNAFEQNGLAFASRSERVGVTMDQRTTECPETFLTAEDPGGVFGAGNFPCIYASMSIKTAAYRSVRLKRSQTRLAADCLRHFLATSRTFAGPASLSVVFEDCEQPSVDSYRDEFWQILQEFHDLDEAPWPQWLPADPTRREWEFCFAGESVFIVCSTPLHTGRRSRWSPHFTLTFQPSWVFDALGTVNGSEVRRRIRERISRYDSLPLHPLIGQD